VTDAVFWPTTPILGGFLVVCLTLNLTPGFDMLFVIGEALRGGARMGRWAALGIAGGSLCHAVLAAAGIATLVATAPYLLVGLTYVGAAYLIWIGVGMVRTAPTALPAPALPTRTPAEPATPTEQAEKAEKAAPAVAVAIAGDTRPLTVFRRGVLVNLLNVKVVLFFLTFLPQFIRPQRGPVWQQVLFFGLTFNVLGTLILFAVAAAAGRLSGTLATRRRPAVVMTRAAGLILIGLAVGLVWSRLADTGD
jgi:threonine/homoserine/homoserine lactone efflux protein